jgi:NADH dehydrogenase [ubiquinone] 1 alpha subcomplex assembly factor 6
MAIIPGYGGAISWRTSVRIARSSDPEHPSSIAAIVRRWDRDRFQTALFAPAGCRDALFALYAFNCEIARVRERVTEPALGHIRLEWWRERIAAAYAGAPPPRHPVCEALTQVIGIFAPARAHFERMLETRAADLGDASPANLAALEEYAEGTSSRLVNLALEVLGARDPAAAEAGTHAGIAYALAGLLRAPSAAARLGRPIIPVEIAARRGLGPEDWQARRSTPALRAAIAEVAAAAASHLSAARRLRAAVPGSALAAMLPTVIAARTLDRLAAAGHDPFDPALARADPWQSWRLALAALRRRY